MAIPERIESNRLFARKPILDDAKHLFTGYAQDPEVTKYMIWKPYQDLSEFKTWLESKISSFGSSDTSYVICERGSGNPIGMFSVRASSHMANIGYVLSRSSWGRGYMTEIGSEVVREFLTQDGVFRVWAVCDVENIGSSKVLSKIGMSCEGILRRWVVHPNMGPDPRDVFCYSIVKLA